MAEFSAEDFARFQTQLLELREKNYVLEDKLKKQSKEHGVLSEQCVRQAAAIRASKKAVEAETISRDNMLLRTRLRDQEEEFKLQHTTLLQELARLSSENERLEQQLSDLCRDVAGDASPDASTDDSKQVLRLRTELSLMENRSAKLEEEHMKKVDALRSKLSSLAQHNSELQQLLGQHSILQEEGSISLGGGGGGVSFKKLSLDDDVPDADPEPSPLQLERDKLEHQLRDLQSRLKETEAAGATSVDRLNEQQQYLQETRAALMEAEARLADWQQRVEEATRRADQASEALAAAEEALRREREEAATREEQAQDVARCLAEVEAALEETRRGAEELAAVASERDAAQARADQLDTALGNKRALIQEMKTHLGELETKHSSDQQRLNEQLEEQRDQHRKQLHLLQVEVSSLRLSAAGALTAQEAAEQLRREQAMTEEHVAQLQDEVASLKEYWQVEREKIEADQLLKRGEIEAHAQQEKQALSTQLEISGIQRQELEEKVQALQKQVSDAQEERVIHERRGLALLKDVKKQLASERRRADRLQDKLTQLLADPATIAGFTVRHAITSKSTTDGRASQRTLQSNLDSDAESTYLPSGVPSDPGDDVSSVSSWSMVSGEQRQQDNNSAPQSPLSGASSTSCPSETAELLARVASLQTALWQREEHLHHLEASAGAMAQDLITKAAIIQNYCLSASPGPAASTPPSSPAAGAGVRRVLTRLREVGGEVAVMAGGGVREESSKEVNRRLQALLEETLLKNLNLHRDVDHLTRQVQQLTELAASAAAGETKAGGGGRSAPPQERMSDQACEDEEIDVTDIMRNPC